MAIVFAAIAGSRVSFMMLFGAGLTLAVIMDATIVRGILVPAFMRLAGRWNWLAPARLARLHAGARDDRPHRRGRHAGAGQRVAGQAARRQRRAATGRVPFRAPDLHTTERPSSTAQWTTLGRTLELERPPAERIVSDEYAPVFLSGPSRALLAPLRLGGPLVRLAERHPLAGVSAFGLCRHRFIDEHLGAALADAATAQVLILGAGYDSRAYRFATEIGARPVYEVDLPPVSRRKAAIVAAHAERFAANRISRVEIDFRTESLATRLAGSGFVAGARTFVVWEGVSMYLSRAAVDATLDTLRTVCGPGSTLAMDFWHELPGRSVPTRVRRLGARAIALIGEPVTFGVAPSQVSTFLGAHGFDVFDLVQSCELAARYATGGRPCEESVYVLAARL